MKYIYVIIAVFLITVSAYAQPRNILVLHSYQQEFPQTKEQHTGFVENLRSLNPDTPLNIFTEYLNAKTSPEYTADTGALDSYLTAKYSRNRPDLIYATNDESLQYLSKTSLLWLKNIPLVFSGITNTPILPRTGISAGILEIHDIGEYTAVINQIFPSKPEIIFLGSDCQATKDLRETINAYIASADPEQKISIQMSADTGTMLDKIGGGSSTVYVIMNSGGFLSDGKHETLPDSLSKLTSGLPSERIFTLHRLEIQKGVLGGLVTSGSSQGEKAAETASDILKGSRLINPFKHSSSRLVFDIQALDRAEIKLPRDLAARSEFINSYPTFLEKYGDIMGGIIIFLVVLILTTSVSFSYYTYHQHQKLKYTSARLAEESRKTQQYMEAVDASNLVSIADKSGRIKYINDQYLMVSGYSREELMGKSHRVLNHPLMDTKQYSSLVRTVTKGRIWYGVLINKTKRGDILYLETSIVPIKNNKGLITEYLSIRKDISQVIRQQKEIQDQYTDMLTSLPNRIKMRMDRKKAKKPAVALINIDSFSVINTFYGLETGDSLLRDVAKQLKSMVRENMRAYRLSGDEFAILASDVSDYDDFNSFVRGVLEDLSYMPYTHGDAEMHLSFTAGTAQGKESLIVRAGMALRHAKKNNKALMTYSEVESEMERIRETVHYSSSLREALSKGRVIPYFQPIADTRDGKIVKYEALMRIEGSDTCLLNPDSFLYLSKQLKLYEALSMMMMEKTLEIVRTSNISVCINFDIEDILNVRLLNKFFELIESGGLHGRVTIEITESEGIDNLDELAAFVTKAKRNGCLIAIDDFGTGYSNFMYILSLQPDFLKIDGSITRQITVSKRARLLVSTITLMCREAGIKTVAEYVSDEDTYNGIRELGIDYCQGYLFGRPSPEAKSRI